MVLAAPVWCAEMESVEQEKPVFNPAETAVILELFTGVPAAMAGYAPRTMGALAVAFSPLAIGEADWRRHPISNGVALAGYYALAGYNLSGPNREGHFSWRTFGWNVAGFNAIAALSAIPYIFEKKDWGKTESDDVSLIPTPGGLLIEARRKF